MESTHDMFKVALKSKNKGINTKCNIVGELPNFYITEAEWTLFKQTQKLLLNFKILSTELCI